MEQRHETINLGVRRSKVKVIRGRRQIWRPDGGIILDAFVLSSFASFPTEVPSLVAFKLPVAKRLFSRAMKARP